MISMGICMVSFAVFCGSSLCTWLWYHRRRRLSGAGVLCVILSAAVFSAGSMADCQVIQERNAVISGNVTHMTDQLLEEGEAYASEWMKQTVLEEEKRLRSLEWNREDPSLCSETNLSNAAWAVSNVMFSAIREYKTLDSDSVQDFLEHRGAYLGEMLLVSGSCSEITDGSELKAGGGSSSDGTGQKLNDLFNPDGNPCTFEAYYFTEEQSGRGFIFWTPYQILRTGSRQDFAAAGGMYAGTVTANGLEYELLISN